MKNSIKTLLTLLLFIFAMITATNSFADAPPPPPPEGGHGGGGNQVPGGGAPIGEGLLILCLLGAGYGTKKWREARNKA